MLLSLAISSQVVWQQTDRQTARQTNRQTEDFGSITEYLFCKGIIVLSDSFQVDNAICAIPSWLFHHLYILPFYRFGEETVQLWTGLKRFKNDVSDCLISWKWSDDTEYDPDVFNDWRSDEPSCNELWMRLQFNNHQTGKWRGCSRCGDYFCVCEKMIQWAFNYLQWKTKQQKGT